MFPPFFWPLFGVFAVLALVALAFDIWMLVDAVQRPEEHFSSRDAKTWWIVGLVVGLVTGLPALVVAIAYYFSVRKPAVEGRVAPAARAASTAPTPPPGASTAPPPPPAPAPQPAPAYCPSCGAKIVAGARFCHSCGAPVGP